MNLQITINSVDPHRLAAFYGSADVGYEFENHSPVVDQLLAQGVLDPSMVVEVGERRGFADAAAVSDRSGRLPRLQFQRTSEPKTTLNRVHLDLQFPGDAAARDATADRLLALGARRIGSGAQGPVHRWIILCDPEGNELCVSN